MLKSYFIGVKLLSVLFFVLFIIFNNNVAEGVVFNDDLQKVSTDYIYYKGFEEDKIIRSNIDNRWYLLKEDESVIGLRGDYLAYIDMEGKYFGFNDDYYRFIIGNDSYEADGSTRFIYVDKNGLECIVNGYTYVDPTPSDKYFIVRNIGSDKNYITGLYDKYNKIEVIPSIYNEFKYINDNSITASKNGKFGLINIDNEVIIPFEYNFIDFINDEFIIAMNEEGKYGVVNINNENILPFEYDKIYNISETKDYCKIIKDNKSGLIETRKGKILIPLRYEDIIYAENGLTVVQSDGKFGVINMYNKIIVPFIYDYIMPYDYLFVVYKDELMGVLDKGGKEILQTVYNNATKIGDNYITVSLYDKNNDIKYAVYNFNGNEIISPKYEYIDYDTYEKDMVIKAELNLKFMDKEIGEEIFKNFSNIKYLNDKYFAAGNGGTYCIFNFVGQQLTSQEYGDVSIINIDGENLIAAELINNEKFNRKVDYFKQNNGPSNWAVNEVTKAIENNLVPCKYQSLFTFNIKRDEFCSVIVSFLEEKFKTSMDKILKEKKADLVNFEIIDDYNYDITSCLSLGIVNGRGNGIFDGRSEITREEAAVMLTNLANYLGLNTYADDIYFSDKHDVSSWAIQQVNYVLQNNIMNGTGNNMFSPKSNLTREQAYIIMHRLLSI